MSNIRTSGISLFSQRRTPKKCKCPARRSDAVQSCVVLARQNLLYWFCHCRTDWYVDTTRMLFIWQERFAKNRYTSVTYWPNVWKNSSALQVLIRQVGLHHSRVPTGPTCICWQPCLTVHPSLSYNAGATLKATVENGRTLRDSLHHVRYRNYRRRRHSKLNVCRECYKGTKPDGLGKPNWQDEHTQRIAWTSAF